MFFKRIHHLYCTTIQTYIESLLKDVFRWDSLLSDWQPIFTWNKSHLTVVFTLNHFPMEMPHIQLFWNETHFYFECPLFPCATGRTNLTTGFSWDYDDVIMSAMASNHQPHYCLLNRLFRRRSKKTSKLRVTGRFVGNSPVTGEFPAKMASKAENVSIWWRHHVEIVTAFATRLCIW